MEAAWHHAGMHADALVPVPLTAPPVVAICGRGLHHPEQRGRYYLPEHWCLHLYRWRGELYVDDDLVPVRPGLWHCCPPRRQLDYHYAPASRHLVVHFRLQEEGPHQLIRHAVCRSGDHRRLADLFEAVVDAWPGQPARSTALLWALLWSLVETPAVEAPTDDPRLVAASRLIEDHLMDGVSVAALAQAVGCSHNQLTRLFRRAYGCTVVGYLRRRRVGRAQHLLVATTMSVGAIGAAVGMPDPQVFNKAFRAVAGCAPSSWRASGAAPCVLHERSQADAD